MLNFTMLSKHKEEPAWEALRRGKAEAVWFFLTANVTVPTFVIIIWCFTSCWIGMLLGSMLPLEFINANRMVTAARCSAFGAIMGESGRAEVAAWSSAAAVIGSSIQQVVKVAAR